MAIRRGPSAFSDSPEDLIRRAEEMVDDERLNLPNAACQLLTDLSRALEKERLDRVSYTNMTREALSQCTRMEKKAEETARLLAHPFELAASAAVARVRTYGTVRFLLSKLGAGGNDAAG